MSREVSVIGLEFKFNRLILCFCSLVIRSVTCFLVNRDWIVASQVHSPRTLLFTMRDFKIFCAPFQSLQWSRKKYSPVNALINEDKDLLVVTTLESLPFRSHADLLETPLEELLAIARNLNIRLPLALQIDVRSGTTILELRHNVEFILGYKRSAPDAMRVPFCIESVARRARPQTTCVTPKTPASPLATKRRLCDMDISMLGQSVCSDLLDNEAKRTEIAINSDGIHVHTPSRPQSTTYSRKSHSLLSPPANSLLSPTILTVGLSRDQPHASTASRRSTSNEHQNSTASFTTPKRRDGLRGAHRPVSSTPVSTRNSPRPPTIETKDMGFLISTMMSLSPNGLRTSATSSVGEFGELQ